MSCFRNDHLISPSITAGRKRRTVCGAGRGGWGSKSMSRKLKPDCPIEKRVAWVVEIRGMTAYAFTETRARAQWLAVKSYRNAFTDRRGEWPRASASRAPRFDRHRYVKEPQRCWAEDQL